MASRFRIVLSLIVGEKQEITGLRKNASPTPMLMRVDLL